MMPTRLEGHHRGRTADSVSRLDERVRLRVWAACTSMESLGDNLSAAIEDDAPDAGVGPWHGP